MLFMVILMHVLVQDEQRIMTGIMVKDRVAMAINVNAVGTVHNTRVHTHTQHTHILFLTHTHTHTHTHMHTSWPNSIYLHAGMLVELNCQTMSSHCSGLSL